MQDLCNFNSVLKEWQYLLSKIFAVGSYQNDSITEC